MAGSYQHIRGRGGIFTMDLIENMRDAHEALEECFDMIEHLAGGDLRKLHEAWLSHIRKRYPHVGIDEKIHGFARFRANIEEDDRGDENE